MSSRPTVQRAEDAARLATERPHAALILSGHRGGWGPVSGPSEAELMADVIVGSGIDRSRLSLEDESRDTLGNAVLVAVRYLRGLAPRPLVVVTSPFHMDRSLTIFRRVLGPTWPVTAIASAPAEGDEERARSEPGYVADDLAALSGVRPGDLATLAARLRQRWPYYERVARLDPSRLAAG